MNAVKACRRYREIMLWFHRDERIEHKEELIKVNGVVVETFNPVKFSEIPSNLGTKINILV